MGALLPIGVWESVAALEAAFERMQADPELAEMMAEATDLVESTQGELCEPLP